MYGKLYWLFFKLGMVSFGGGYPMMSMILEEGQKAVGLTAAEFADLTALELLASGPIAINGATYVGYIKGGLIGAVFATLGVCTPPFILTALLYYFLKKYEKNRYVNAFLDAIKIACGGVLMSTAFALAQDILFYSAGIKLIVQNPLTYVNGIGLCIFGLCLLALIRFKMNPIAVILGSGAAGLLFIR